MCLLYTSNAVKKNQVGIVVLCGKLGVSGVCSWRWYVHGHYMDVSISCTYGSETLNFYFDFPLMSALCRA